MSKTALLLIVVLNLGWVQGSRRTLTGVAPSLTVTEGYPGMIFDGQWRPFVTGLIPTVGAYPVMPSVAPPVTPPVTYSPLRAKIARLRSGEADRHAAPASGLDRSSQPPTPSASSTAARPDLSLTQIRAMQAAQPGGEQRVDELLQEAAAAQHDGHPYAARQLLRQALKAAPAHRREAIAAEIERLDQSIKARLER